MYQGMTNAEREEAIERVRRYLEVVCNIYDRIHSNPAEYAKFRALTETPERGTLHGTDSSDEDPT